MKKILIYLSFLVATLAQADQKLAETDARLLAKWIVDLGKKS
jgi:hypothetical protein